MRTDLKSLFEIAGVDLTKGKAKTLVEASMVSMRDPNRLQAAWVLNDEGFAEVERPVGHAGEAFKYAEPVTWAEAQRRVLDSLRLGKEHFGEDTTEAANSWFEFSRMYRQTRGRVMMYQDEFLAVFV